MNWPHPLRFLRTRWAPRLGLTTRIALSLVATIMIGITLAVIVFFYELRRHEPELFSEEDIQELIVTVSFIESQPLEYWNVYLNAIGYYDFRIAWRWDEPDFSTRRFNALPPQWDDRLTEVLRPLGDRPRKTSFIVAEPPRGQARLAQPTPPPRSFLIPDGRLWLVVAVETRAGPWLMFRIEAENDRETLFLRLMVWGLFILGAIILIAVLAARWLARPLRRLAVAADRLGVDLSTPPLSEHGPPEVRASVRAFNLMQTRISRLIEDRTMMLAALSHDLRTVLTRLRLRTEFIDDDEQRDRATGDVEDMAQMVESALSLARDDSEAEDTVLCQIGPWLLDVVADYQNPPVDVVGPDDLEVLIRPGSLKRCVLNLVNNARYYAKECEVTFSSSGTDLEIMVHDRGAGLDDVMKEQVMKPFFRKETSRNRDTGGAGLGLAIVRMIARKQGGEVTLEDREGGGLSARLRIPALSENSG